MEHAHSQTQSFLRLFPVPRVPPDMESLVAQCLNKNLSEIRDFYSGLPAFIGLSAVPPAYDHEMAEKGGRDYACEIYAHFEGDWVVLLGDIPYPGNNGEFIIGGHRYYIPMFLRTSYQIQEMTNKGILLPSWSQKADGKKEKVSAEARRGTESDSHQEILEQDTVQSDRDDRNTNNLRLVLVADLLEVRFRRVLGWAFRKIVPEIQIALSREAQAPAMHAILKTYLGGCLEKPVRRFLLYRAGRMVDRHNPLARFCQQKELSFYGPGGVHPESVGHLSLRDVNESDLYRICPVQTPQGHAVGLRLYLARRAGVDVQSGTLLAPDIPQPGDSLGDAASLIPFIEHDDVTRALMGANMMKQALPLEISQAPWVQTGCERELASRPEVAETFKANGSLALGANILVGYLPWGLDTFEDGIVISQSGAAALTSVQEEIFWFEETREWWEGRFRVTEVTGENPNLNESARKKLDERGIITVGQEVEPRDVLVSAILTRSKNVNKTKTIDRLIAVIFGQDPEELRDISLHMPHNFRGRVVEIIDSASQAASSMALASKVLRRIGVRVRRVEPLAVGDKLTGRHGNKGVVVRILPDWKMPYMKVQNTACADRDCRMNHPHRHLQMILNPLGVTGRLNVGQLYETALAKVAEIRGAPHVVRPFVDSWTPESLANQLGQYNFEKDGKEQLYVLEDGSEKPFRYRSLVGPQYILRLYHRAREKAHGRGMGQPWEYAVRDDQPLQGKAHNGGQRIGEMETWALAGHSAWHVLDDFLTVKSDDRALRKNSGENTFKWYGKRRPTALVNLALAARALGMDQQFRDAQEKDVTSALIERFRGVDFSRVTLDLATPAQMEQWDLRGEIRSPNLYATTRSGHQASDLELWPDREGLFSRVIFEKPWHMGRIALVHPILHPLAARGLWEVFNYPEKFKEAASWWWATELFDRLKNFWPMIEPLNDPKKTLENWKIKDTLKGMTGETRQPKDYLLSCLAVLPPRFRMEQLGKVADFKHDLNLLYRNVITANSRLKVLIDNKAPESIVKDGRERLFRAVQSLFLGDKSLAGLVGILKGKKGLLRGHLAGKRSDFSGRAVIVGDPTVRLDEVRLPQSIWSAVFPDQGEANGGSHLVLLNRQPSLHRYSMQAFNATPHNDGDVIRLNPFVCKAFNADFDGDTMAVHVPRKPQARSEVDKFLPSRNLFSQANGGLVLGFGGDLALGAIYISHHPSIQSDEEVPLTDEDECLLSDKHCWEEVTVRGIPTTVGRLLLRRVFQSFPIPNRRLESRDGTWNRVLDGVASLGSQEIKRFTDGLSKLLVKALEGSGLSLSVSDVAVLGNDFNSALDVEAKRMKPGFLWLSRQAGAKGDLKHLIGPRGQMRRPGASPLDSQIESGLMKGHTEVEYLLSAHGARAGLVDRGLNTAPAGILLRRLIYTLQGIYIVSNDCQTSDGLEANGEQIYRLVGRFRTDGNLVERQEQAGPVRYRSPYKCRATAQSGRWGICQRCYGQDPATGRLPEIGLPEIGLPVGILAAQAIGERASQLALRTFHGGGIEGALDLKILREQIFQSKVTSDASASQWLGGILKGFEQHPDPPRQVHFEVILRGMLEQTVLDRNFLADITYSITASNLLRGAAGRAKDDLWGVISRIVSGRLIDTGPQTGVGG